MTCVPLFKEGHNCCWMSNNFYSKKILNEKNAVFAKGTFAYGDGDHVALLCRPLLAMWPRFILRFILYYFVNVSSSS